jgi:hypothetical protein
MRHWREREFERHLTPQGTSARASRCGASLRAGAARLYRRRDGDRPIGVLAHCSAARDGPLRHSCLWLPAGPASAISPRLKSGGTFHAQLVEARRRAHAAMSATEARRPRTDSGTASAARCVAASSPARREGSRRDTSCRAAIARTVWWHARNFAQPAEGGALFCQWAETPQRHRGPGGRRPGCAGEVTRPISLRNNLPANVCDGALASARRLSTGRSQKMLSIRRGRGEGSDQVSVTGAFAGIAETGTVVMASGPDHPVSLNLLPDTHVVVLREDPTSSAVTRMSGGGCARAMARTCHASHGQHHHWSRPAPATSSRRWNWARTGPRRHAYPGRARLMAGRRRVHSW